MTFWANKLNGGTYTPPVSPVRTLNPANYPQPVSSHQTVPVEPYRGPTEPQYVPSVRMIQGDNCPGCGSTNYRGRVGDRAIACPECGFHPRFEQTGYGTPSLRAEAGQATPARQPANTSNLKASIALLNAGGGERI